RTTRASSSSTTRRWRRTSKRKSALSCCRRSRRPRIARSRRLKPEPEGRADPARVELVAMRYLARREYASIELVDKLVQRGYDDAVVRTVVRALGEAGLQDDARYTEAFIRSRVTRG